MLGKIWIKQTSQLHTRTPIKRPQSSQGQRDCLFIKWDYGNIKQNLIEQNTRQNETRE